MSHPVFWVSQMAKSKTEKTQMIVCKSFLRWKREKETNNNKKKTSAGTNEHGLWVHVLKK